MIKKLKSWLFTGFMMIVLAIFLVMIGYKIYLSIQYIEAQRDYYRVLVKYHNDVLIKETEIVEHVAE